MSLLPEGFSIQDAVVALLGRREQEGAQPPWSIAELALAEDDYTQLRAWAASTPTQDLRKDLASSRELMRVDKAPVTSAEATGLVLLALFAEHGRRHGGAHRLWPACRALFVDPEALFDPAGHPIRELKDALVEAAQRFELRHVPPASGGHCYYLTVSLQFGLPVRDVEARLPAWLTGVAPDAVELLCAGELGSGSFRLLWQALVTADPDTLRQAIRSPWIAPGHAESFRRGALAPRASAMRAVSEEEVGDAGDAELVTAVRLVWDVAPSGEQPRLEATLALDDLGTTGKRIDVLADGQRIGRAFRQASGRYALATGGAVVLPPLEVVHLCLQLDTLDIVARQDVVPFGGEEIVAVFDLASGARAAEDRSLRGRLNAVALALPAGAEMNLPPARTASLGARRLVTFDRTDAELEVTLEGRTLLSAGADVLPVRAKRPPPVALTVRCSGPAAGDVVEARAVEATRLGIGSPESHTWVVEGIRSLRTSTKPRVRLSLTGLAARGGRLFVVSGACDNGSGVGHEQTVATAVIDHGTVTGAEHGGTSWYLRTTLHDPVGLPLHAVVWTRNGALEVVLPQAREDGTLEVGAAPDARLIAVGTSGKCLGAFWADDATRPAVTCPHPHALAVLLRWSRFPFLLDVFRQDVLAFYRAHAGEVTRAWLAERATLAAVGGPEIPFDDADHRPWLAAVGELLGKLNRGEATKSLDSPAGALAPLRLIEWLVLCEPQWLRDYHEGRHASETVRRGEAARCLKLARPHRIGRLPTEQQLEDAVAHQVAGLVGLECLKIKAECAARSDRPVQRALLWHEAYRFLRGYALALPRPAGRRFR